MTKISDSLLRLLLGCVLVGIYLLIYSPRIDSIDGEALAAVAVSFVQHGSADIGVLGAEDGLLTPEKVRMGVYGEDGALYSKKGVTPSLLMIPLVAAAEIIPWLDMRATLVLLNPLVTALTAGLLYTLVRWLRYSQLTAWLTGFIFGAVTFALVYTKTLYGEPLAGLFLLVTVMTIYRYWENGSWRSLLGAGVALGFLIGINLIYLLTVPIMALAVWLGRRKNRQENLWAWFWLGLPIFITLILIGLYNTVRFGSPLAVGYISAGEGFYKPLLQGLYGLTISPYRGIFWYNPILLLAIPGWLLLRKQARSLALLAVVLVVTQIFAFASWSSWEGGVVWGPRFLLPITPLLVLMVAPLVEAARKSWVLGGAVVGLAGVTVGIQVLGALYSIYPYSNYLLTHYYNPVTETVAPEMISSPGLSPVLGHLALAQMGWSVEPAWLQGGINGVHLVAVMALMGTAIAIAMWRPRRGALWITAVTVFSLNVVVAQQQAQPAAQQIQALSQTLQPAGTVVAWTTAFGESLLDLEGFSNVVSINAPTPSTDPLAMRLWEFARQQSGYLWFLTWFAPGDPANWQEQDLWEHSAFVKEANVAGHRALLFNQSQMPQAVYASDTHFGSIGLEHYGVSYDGEGLWLTLRWSVSRRLNEDSTWFVHILDENNQIIAQQDRAPQGGYAPTSTWEPDVSVTDYLYFPDVEDAAGIQVGFVDADSGERLPVFGRGNVPLPTSFALLAWSPSTS